jgi:inhibitor of KinA
VVPGMSIEPLGDSALIVRVVDDFARDPEASLDRVQAALRSLEAAAIPGVTELAPAYSTIGVFFDVAEIARAAAGEEILVWLSARIESALKKRPAHNKKSVATPVIEIPVCYDREFGSDLDDVARVTGLAEAEVIRRHASAAYRVACVGFIAGFPFLSGLPAELATPRRAVPRKEVPAGSVAIGGAQTGIYLRNSPGGWNVIGRTPLRLFDVQHEPPTILQAGDRVRFREISREEFESLSQ